MLNKATLKILLGLYTAKHRRFGYGFASADDNALKIIEFADVVFNSFMDCPQMVGKFFHIRNLSKQKADLSPVVLRRLDAPPRKK